MYSFFSGQSGQFKGISGLPFLTHPWRMSTVDQKESAHDSTIFEVPQESESHLLNYYKIKCANIHKDVNTASEPMQVLPGRADVRWHTVC